jgi:hypothetical protein
MAQRLRKRAERNADIAARKVAPDPDAVLCDGLLVDGKDERAFWRHLCRQRIAKQAHASWEQLGVRAGGKHVP